MQLHFLASLMSLKLRAPASSFHLRRIGQRYTKAREDVAISVLVMQLVLTALSYRMASEVTYYGRMMRRSWMGLRRFLVLLPLISASVSSLSWATERARWSRHLRQ
ncbi:hypothetical protein B296_00042585 [Ensete ventricosum]|uniref:Uncharacterized protein n=1 Tax=Ensete ventricosum TaxID=4639 RepID=A0A426XWF6_ENSVE|nr:hypothetical protein B296_00042585 [Ensete ventricosum]